MKLSEIFPYARLSRYEGLLGKTPLQNKYIYFGIEVEAENIAQNTIRVPGSWKVVEDGSLKVNGLEFVTVPIKLMYLEVELQRLFDAIPEAEFSPRTSIHTHMNVRDLTGYELEKMLLLYMIFERVLYKISGDRFSNNFCVPIYEAPHLAKKFLTDSFEGGIRKEWSKYHGLNLTPIWGQENESARIGTAEFRHMAGTNDITHIINWCDTIACLKSASKKIRKEDLIQSIILHETGSKEFIYRVFGNHANIITQLDNCTEMIRQCTSKTKQVLASTGRYSDAFGMISI